jgi:hypothetical protein
LSRDLDKAHKVGQGSKVQLPNDGKSKAKALAEAGISTRASRSAFAQATVQPTLCGGTLPAVWMRDGYDHYPLKNFASRTFRRRLRTSHFSEEFWSASACVLRRRSRLPTTQLAATNGVLLLHHDDLKRIDQLIGRPVLIATASDRV